MKILLIEDRVARQELFLEEVGIDLENYADVLDNFINDEYEEFKEQMLHDSFSFAKYDIIISHKSAYENDNSLIISNLKNYAKNAKKTLIFFSGGVSVNYYDNSEFELLELNSKTFYSQNLKLFLDALRIGDENILMLCYGENWKLNVVSNVLEKTTLFLFKVIDEDIEFNEFTKDTEINKLSSIKYPFYEMEIVNGYVYKNEINKFHASLQEYCSYSGVIKHSSPNKEQNSFLIHNNNIVDITLFPSRLRFTTGDDIDTYISAQIIPKLLTEKFDKIFIKDNLSANYLELYGLRVAYHVRLSQTQQEKRFVPIIIISEFDSATLMQFTKDAEILFTEGIHLCGNIKEEILKYQSLELEGLEAGNYDKFLNKIEVKKPKDTTGSHGIANKWSIYRWAEFLKVESDAIAKNREDIENQLYFKYLKAKYSQHDSGLKKIIKPSKAGKVLLIDDEWAKGWKDILKTALTVDGLEFDAFEYDFKDKTNFNMIVQLNHKKLKEQIVESDVVILDLRLLESDHENEDLESYTGIKILQKIHEINAGIQVIMLTATSKSIILERLYKKKILGYIKKEHPDDSSIDTVENINKLVGLVDSGLERKYLKEMYLLKIQIMDILNNDPFCKFISKKEEYEYFLGLLQKNSQYVFDILDSNLGNKFNYAMVSIATSLESIVKIFLHGKNDLLFWDEEEAYLNEKSKLEDKITKILNKKMGYKEDVKLEDLITHRNRYMHSNSEYKEVTEEKISDWFGEFLKIMQLIENPPNYIPFDKSKKKESKHLNFKKDKI